MNIYLVNYATPGYAQSQKRLNHSALKFGIDHIQSYTPAQIRRTQFYCQNKKLLSYRRGGGYYVWKPYIILETLKTLEIDDFLIYSDSGIEIINNLSPLLELCRQQQGILLFQTHDLLKRVWTKRDCFVLMNCDSELYHNSEQLMSGFAVFMKNERSINLIKEWLHYCQQINIISDLPNICGLDNFPDFREHRHDQFILSLLAIKHQLMIFRDPSQWGNHYKLREFRESGEFLSCPNYSERPSCNSPYSTLINVHLQHSEHPLLRVKQIILHYFRISI